MTHLIETALDTPNDRMLRKMKGGDQVKVLIAPGKAGKSLHVIETGFLSRSSHVTQYWDLNMSSASDAWVV